MQPAHTWIALSILACVSAPGTGCAFSKRVQVTSDPPGATVYLGQHEVGKTPMSVRVDATGLASLQTFYPQHVTPQLVRAGARRNT